ncbi:MAG: molybdenum cofactor guanylyltransferase [Acidimicrobiales bacterium]
MTITDTPRDPLVAAPAGVILAGGEGRRLGGVDKGGLSVAGISLLTRVLAALAVHCHPIVVVGGAHPCGSDASGWGGVDVAGQVPVRLSDSHGGGGPVPAVGDAVRYLRDLESSARGKCVPSVMVLSAVDLALLRADHIGGLLAGLATHRSAPAVAARGPGGRPNPLLAAYRLETLSGPFEPDQPAGRLLGPGSVVVGLDGDAEFNLNTPEDLAEATRRLTGTP